MSIYAINKSGFPSRLPHILQFDLNERLSQTLKTDEGKLCYGWYEKDSFCSFNEKGALKNLYVVGDSNMQWISEAVVKKFAPNGYRITTMNSSACYFIPNSFSGINGKARNIRNEPCDEEFQSLRLSEIQNTDDNLIIIGGMLDVYLRQDQLGFESANSKSIEENLLTNIYSLAESGSKIVLVYPYPRSKVHMGKFAFDALNNVMDVPSVKKSVRKMIDETSYPLSHFDSYSEEAFKILDSIDSENVIRVYPHNLFCDVSQCQFLNQSNLYLADRNHPTRYLAPRFAELIYDEVKRSGW